MATPEHLVSICAVAQLTPRMRRITVTGESLRTMSPTPAQEIALGLIENGRPVRRRYTIRSFDPQALRLDIDVVLHGHGPGSAWGAHAEVGDSLAFAGPRGALDLPSARPGVSAHWHLLIADESGIPAVAALIDAAAPDDQIIAMLEVADEQERQEIHARPSLQIEWVHRDGRPAGRPDAITGALAGVTLPPGDGAAIVLGESKAAITIRDELLARGIERRAIVVKGYWNLGRDRPRGPAVDSVVAGGPIALAAD